MSEVQGAGRPRAMERAPAAPGTPLGSLCPRRTSGVAPLQRAPPESGVGGIPTEPRRPRKRARPAPRPAPTSGRLKNLELRRPAGTSGTDGERTGHAQPGCARAPTRRSCLAPQATAAAESCRSLSPSPILPILRRGVVVCGGIFFKAQWESWEFRVCERRSLSSPSSCVTWVMHLDLSVPQIIRIPTSWIWPVCGD